MQKLKKLGILFVTMLKIGLFTFGGGYAMISLLENEFTQKKGWLKSDEFLDIIAIAESTPGPIAINSATYIGYKLCGVWGSVVATLGVCIPSFTIIYLISLFFNKFLALKVVAAAFKGIQVCVVFLILIAGIKMFKQMQKNVFSYTIMTATFVAMVVVNILAVNFSAIFYILISGGLGLLIYGIHLIRQKQKTALQDTTNTNTIDKTVDNSTLVQDKLSSTTQDTTEQNNIVDDTASDCQSIVQHKQNKEVDNADTP